mmetsp:Transcript_96912/g.278904  ORF Transcript_96912/g.278904 Transcript_96912/m.278904 type:complete len:212 (+) Transcript_96912:811-1446(+)
MPRVQVLPPGEPIVHSDRLVEQGVHLRGAHGGDVRHEAGAARDQHRVVARRRKRLAEGGLPAFVQGVRRCPALRRAVAAPLPLGQIRGRRRTVRAPRPGIRVKRPRGHGVRTNAGVPIAFEEVMLEQVCRAQCAHGVRRIHESRVARRPRRQPAEVGRARGLGQRLELQAGLVEQLRGRTARARARRATLLLVGVAVRLQQHRLGPRAWLR